MGLPSRDFMRPMYTSCREHHQSQDRYIQRLKERQIQLQNKFLPLTAPPMGSSTNMASESPFLRLPTEIRLHIYSLLVLPQKPLDLLPSFEKVSSSTQDYFDYDKKQHGTDRPATANLSQPTLLMRTVDPLRYSQRFPKHRPMHERSTYSVRCDRFRARCMSTTYHCVNNPNIDGQLSILGANKQIHAEAAELLYSSYTFDFDTHIEAVVPFLSDLTAFARSCIKSIRVVKRALAYEKEFDKCEWSNTMSYLANTSTGISLRRLELGVVAGRPGANGWDRIATYTATDFGLLKAMEGMEWMRDLMQIKGLQELDVSAVVEHCPPATNSMAMASYIRFSASVEGGLATYLQQQMIHA